MAQISASYHLQVRSHEHLKSTDVTTITMIVHTVEWNASIGTHNSPLEGAMKLKFEPKCSS